MLVGRTPFQSASEYLTFQAILQHCDSSQPLQYPDTISASARDLITSFLLPNPADRLGAGDKGSDNDIPNAVHSHAFFRDMPWENLAERIPPYVPDPSTFPPSDQMRDGAYDDWLFEGEATPIMMQSYGSTESGEVAGRVGGAAAGVCSV